MNDMNPTPDNFLQLDNETKIKFCNAWHALARHYNVCKECGVSHSALVRCLVTAKCHDCGGRHEPSGARSDCIAYWRQRAWKAEGVTAHANEKAQR